MDTEQRRTTSIVSASAVALLTLCVFFVSLNKGPASAVTRFHEGLSRPDAALVRDVTGGDVNSAAALDLRARIAYLLRIGSRFQITRVEKVGTNAQVLVVYQSPSGNLYSVPFKLWKTNGTWVIDSEKTLSLIARQDVG